MKILNMLIALATVVLLTGSAHAMQTKHANDMTPSLYNSIINPSVQQNNNAQLRLAKDQLCKSDRETGIVRCTTTS